MSIRSIIIVIMWSSDFLTLLNISNIRVVFIISLHHVSSLSLTLLHMIKHVNLFFKKNTHNEQDIYCKTGI